MQGSGYRVFTDRHDRVVRAEDLDGVIGTRDVAAWKRAVQNYEDTAVEWITRAGLAAIPVIDETRRNWSRGKPGDHVASLLVDHSGSLRGQKAILSCVLVEVLADAFERLGIRYEILGFTTASWRGGKSRRRWQFRLRPKNPGRLCDLLHIVYRTADTRVRGAPRTIRNLLRPGLLKENVDGEALLWAAARLEACAEKYRTILVVSDGAPVDDSTLMANSETYLADHLGETIAEISGRPHTRIGGVGLDYDVSGYYPRNIMVNALADLDERLIRFAADLVGR